MDALVSLVRGLFPILVLRVLQAGYGRDPLGENASQITLKSGWPRARVGKEEIWEAREVIKRFDYGAEEGVNGPK